MAGVSKINALNSDFVFEKGVSDGTLAECQIPKTHQITTCQLAVDIFGLQSIFIAHICHSFTP